MPDTGNLPAALRFLSTNQLAAHSGTPLNETNPDNSSATILIKSHENLGSLRDAGSMKSWLFQIANRSIIDYYRRSAKAGALDAGDLWYERDDPGVHQELSECVEPFINALPTDSAKLLRAIDIEGRSQKDYAAAQDVPYTTMKSRVQKARGELRGLFDNCCRYSLDAAGNIADYDPKTDHCRKC